MRHFNRKMLRLFAMAGMLAVAVAGCGNEEGNGEIIEIETQSVAYQTLPASSASKFSYSDLTINGLKYGSSEQETKAVLGEPMAVRDSANGEERTYFYDQMTLSFIKKGQNYTLYGTRVTGGNYSLPRGIKLGDSKDALLNTFYRDENCLNQNVMSLDGEEIIGKFLYGDVTMADLEEKKLKDTVNYAIISYDGFDSMETATQLTYSYTCFEKPFIKEYATMDDDYGQLHVQLDDKGIVTEISWYYYDEIK